MLTASRSLCLLLAAGLLQALPLPGAAFDALAQSENHSRPIAAVVTPKPMSLNNLLMQVLRKELPAFEPVLISTPFAGETAQLLADLAQAEDNPLLPNSFGGQEFPEAEAGWLKHAELVIVPRWTYSDVTLSGPHAPAQEWEFWSLRAESDLDLSVDVYRRGQSAPVASFKESFKPGKTIPIRDLDQLLKLVKDVSGVEVDITNSLHQALVLDVLRKLPSFKQILSEDPASYLIAESTQAVTASGLRAISAGFRAQKGFAGGSETVQQPVSSGGNLGLTVALRGGTSTLMTSDPANPYIPAPITSYFCPNVELEVGYDIGRLFNWPDFLVTLGAGGTFTIAPYFGSPAPIGITGELGLLKRWFFGSWSLDTGLSGGLLFGMMANVQNPVDTMTTFGFSGTGRVGVSYQITPQFA
ncbi:MAG: hypothetical protein ACAI44_22015, partial [Candidatus Sericytochromatia bacterium]